MSKLLYFDFSCRECNHVFEEMVDPSTKEILCEKCGATAFRQISAPTLDPRLGVSSAFPTLMAKWEKKTRQRAKRDNMQGDNLWMH